MKLIKAALFDVDGVLLDTEIFQYQAWAETIEQLAKGSLSEDEYKQRHCGNSTQWNGREIKKQFNFNQALDEIIEHRERIVMQKVKDEEIIQMPYAAEVLEYFAKKLPTALVTGSGAQECGIKLERSGLGRIVGAYKIPIISGDMVEHGKPAPDLYIWAAGKLGIAPRDSIAFEDTMAGIESAENAGVVCLAVPNDWSKHKMLGRNIFADLKEAQQSVERNYLLQPRR
ncbi:HAD family phosphatase [Candidatus Woesearchaeota archaeon]|nr:HAD family phosphatase [Candidatus Woesearchaeota archaeon]